MVNRFLDMALVLVAIAALVFGFISGEFGLVLGLVAALFTARLLFNLLLVQKRRAVSTRVAGTVACPDCGSLQTDRVTEPLADGTDRLHWRCFACDKAWD